MTIGPPSRMATRDYILAGEDIGECPNEIERLRSKNAELEAWLVEERANLILEKIRGGSIITLQDPAERSANAIRQLQAEGKIGGGDGE